MLHLLPQTRQFRGCVHSALSDSRCTTCNFAAYLGYDIVARASHAAPSHPAAQRVVQVVQRAVARSGHTRAVRDDQLSACIVSRNDVTLAYTDSATVPSALATELSNIDVRDALLAALEIERRDVAAEDLLVSELRHRGVCLMDVRHFLFMT